MLCVCCKRLSSPLCRYVLIDYAKVVIVPGQKCIKKYFKKSGVPQGSVLGPLLYLVYINDLEKGMKSSINFFADDTSLFSTVYDPKIPGR